MEEATRERDGVSVAQKEEQTWTSKPFGKTDGIHHRTMNGSWAAAGSHHKTRTHDTYVVSSQTAAFNYTALVSLDEHNTLMNTSVYRLAHLLPVRPFASNGAESHAYQRHGRSKEARRSKRKG